MMYRTMHFSTCNTCLDMFIHVPCLWERSIHLARVYNRKMLPFFVCLATMQLLVAVSR